MPVVDILGLVKIAARAILWVLLSPITLVTFVVTMMYNAFTHIEEFWYRLKGTFIVDLYQAPIQAFQQIVDDPNNTLLSWIGHTFAFDYILPFLYHIPEVFLWFVIIIVMFVTGLLSTVVFIFIRNAWARAMNTIFTK